MPISKRNLLNTLRKTIPVYGTFLSTSNIKKQQYLFEDTAVNPDNCSVCQ